MGREVGCLWMAVGHGLDGRRGEEKGGREGGGGVGLRPVWQYRDAEFILKEWAMGPCTWLFFLLPETYRGKARHARGITPWRVVGATCTGERPWGPVPPEHTTTYVAWTE